MKKFLIVAAVLFSFSGVAHAQTQVTISCAPSFTQNLYSDADAQTFKDRCTAAGGTSSSGATGTDATGSYVVGTCSNVQCSNNGTTATPASNTSGKLTYTPLEPLNNASADTYNSLSKYLALMFNILLSLGAMIAVITLVLGGIAYMVTEVAATKEAAKRRIRAAVIGLLLLLSCWLILNTINPNLVTLCIYNLDQPCTKGGTNTAPITTAGSNQPSGSTTQTPDQISQQETTCKQGGASCALTTGTDGTVSCTCVGV